MDESSLLDLLECSVCLERLDTTAKVLPCQHTFCRRCLESIVSSRHELRCPECRILVGCGVDELPANILLVRLLDGIRQRPRVGAGAGGGGAGGNCAPGSPTAQANGGTTSSYSGGNPAAAAAGNNSVTVAPPGCHPAAAATAAAPTGSPSTAAAAAAASAAASLRELAAASRSALLKVSGKCPGRVLFFSPFPPFSFSLALQRHSAPPQPAGCLHTPTHLGLSQQNTLSVTPLQPGILHCFLTLCGGIQSCALISLSLFLKK